MSTFAEYQAIDAVNWSTLKHLRVSPRHYRWALDHPRRDTQALALGRAVHVAVLEPDRFPLTCVVWQGGDRRGDAWRAFKAAHEGQTLLTEHEYALCLAMRDAVRTDPIVAPYLDGLEAEVTIEWTDEPTGLRCKARLDGLQRRKGERAVLLDLKSTRSIDARQFSADCARMGYHCQLAHYAAGCKAALGLDVEALIVAVEKEPPHDRLVTEVDEDGALYAGEEERRALLRRLAECRAANEWPGRYSAVQTLELPKWVYDDEGDGSGALNGPAAWLMGQE